MKSYEGFEVYRFKSQEVNFDNPINLGFTNLKQSKLFKYETTYDKPQQFFDSNLEGKLQLH